MVYSTNRPFGSLDPVPEESYNSVDMEFGNLWSIHCHSKGFKPIELTLGTRVDFKPLGLLFAHENLHPITLRSTCVGLVPRWCTFYHVLRTMNHNWWEALLCMI